jgi:glutamine synthetase
MTTSPTWAERTGLHSDERQRRCADAAQRMHSLSRVRVAWCDLHGTMRCKTLLPQAAVAALGQGVGMVSTLFLKDTADRSAFQVFAAGAVSNLPAGFGAGNNCVLLPDPASLVTLPHAPDTGWIRATPYWADGTPVALDSRSVLQQQLDALAAVGYGLRCGLELEFHVFAIDAQSRHADWAQTAWPGPAPTLHHTHPGFTLLSERHADACDAVLRTVQQLAQHLQWPLQSLEVEFGPSQFEVVLAPQDALAAADTAAQLRNLLPQALARQGLHASFMAVPPFEPSMASGWHLHQSLQSTEAHQPANAFMRAEPAEHTLPDDATYTLSRIGAHWLAGLLHHAGACALLAAPTTNSYRRFKPHALAPTRALWGHDNRGALLRVLGSAGDPATRIENRLGDASANAYLYMASQAAAGLLGLTHRLQAPLATRDPYGGQSTDGSHTLAPTLPTSLDAALQALCLDTAFIEQLGRPFVDALVEIKHAESQRHAQAADPHEFERREYLARL